MDCCEHTKGEHYPNGKCVFAACGCVDIEPNIVRQPVDIEEELKDKFCDLADQEFPKGDKGRGQAMVLVALCLQAAQQFATEQRLVELDLLEQALNDGRDLQEYKLQRLEALTKDGDRG